MIKDKWNNIFKLKIGKYKLSANINYKKTITALTFLGAVLVLAGVYLALYNSEVIPTEGKLIIGGIITLLTGVLTMLLFD